MTDFINNYKAHIDMNTKDKSTTTVCVESTDRDAINEFAESLNLSQRQMVSRLVETYRASLSQKDSAIDAVPSEVILAAIQENLDKILKRDDRIVAFIKEQEKVLLKPILQTVQSTDSQLKLLNDILSNLE